MIRTITFVGQSFYERKLPMHVENKYPVAMQALLVRCSFIEAFLTINLTITMAWSILRCRQSTSHPRHNVWASAG